MSAQVVSVNVGKPEPGEWTGRVGQSAIRKLPVEGPVRVLRDGLVGDHRADKKYHGGVDNAVYAFAREDLDHWVEALGMPIPDGHFGENLTTTGLDLNEALIGERWRVGTALLEVAHVRTPCRVFQGWMGETGFDDASWIKRFTAVGRPGPYLRVLEEGTVERGDPLIVEHRPDHDVTVGLLFRALRIERELMPQLAGTPGLSRDAGK